MRRMLPVVLAMAGVAAAGGVLLFARESEPAHALTNCDVSHAAMEANELEALALINSERAKVGVEPLLPSQNLSRAAAWMAEDAVVNQVWNDDHTDSLGRSFQTRMRDCGQHGSNGETLGQAVSPEDIVAGWMNSTLHRKIMLDANYKYAGVGRYEFVWALDVSTLNSDGTTVPTVPGLSPTATNTPTRTPTPTATPTPIVTVVPGRAIVPLVVVE
jgi:hypothetical protein